MTDTSKPFAVELDRSGAHLTVYVSGELDPATSPDFADQVRAGIDSTVVAVALDMSEVTFCDSSGLAALLGVRSCAENVGATVRLLDPTPQLRRVLKLTGLDHALQVAGRVALAIDPV